MDEIEIIPAIMPKSFRDIKEKAESVKDQVSWIQIDVMNKTYTPSNTWPYSETNDFANLFDEEGLPFWQDVSYEVDLMLSNPFVEASKWIEIGVERAIFHFASSSDIIDILQKTKEKYGDNRWFCVEIVLAVTTEDDLSKVKECLPYLDAIQVMGIYPVGVQGSDFKEKTYDTIKKLREFTDLPISIDGGVSCDNAIALVEVGANRLVSGSFIFNQDNPAIGVGELKNCIKTDLK